MATIRPNSTRTGTDDPAQGYDDPRVYLAAERTLLAWIRTGVAMMGLGFLVARFGLFLREIVAIRGGTMPKPHQMSLWLGSGLVLLGVIATLLATGEYLWMLRRLRMLHQVGSLRLAMTAGLAAVMAAAGLVMAWYLLFL